MLGCRDRVGGDRDCLGSGPGPCRVGSGTVPGGRGVEGWCGGTGQHSVGKARHRHGMARECHGMARECHGGGTADLPKQPLFFILLSLCWTAHLI